MAHVLDWNSAAIEWTVNGHELSVPLVANVSARQAKAVCDAVEAGLHLLRRDDVIVGYVEPDDGTQAELLLTCPQLLALDPGLIRHTIDASADAAANAAAQDDTADEGVIRSWVAALRAAP